MTFMQKNWRSKLMKAGPVWAVAGVCSLSLGLPGHAAAAPIDLGTGTYTQNFNTLITAGEAATNRNNRKPSSSDGRTLPATVQPGLDGWALNETGTSGNVDGEYAYTDGASGSSETWATGTIGSTERSLGSTRSGSIRARYGAEFRNDASASALSVNISYTGEMWRLGATGTNRDSDSERDRLDFQYSTDATGVGDADGTWIDLDTLDFDSASLLDQNGDLFTAEATGAKDGNAAEYREAITDVVTFASPVAVGETFWIRWVDFNAASSDDILSIDDVSVSTNLAVPEPGSMALALFGLGFLVPRRRRRARA